jgi:3-hydroxyacyl-CoA dehydrogenase/enoyl-CoA hydratase/3-hydroxybutyryl-CoA epimerase
MIIEFQNWTKELDIYGIAWLGLDCHNSSANVINHDVLDELNILIQKIGKDESIKGLVIYSKKSSGFIAGADVHTFSKYHEPDQVRDFLKKGLNVFNRIEQLTIPTVAMIDGFCMGGGYELALACRYRVASDRAETKIGLPEVLLGIHPGWGGTVRLTKLVGGFDALTKVMLSGKPASAKAAKAIGMVDEIAPVRQLRRVAEYYIVEQPKPHQPTFLQKFSNHDLSRKLLSSVIKGQLVKKINVEQYPAPMSMVYLWEKYFGMGSKAYEKETESVLNLVFEHPTAENLIRAFLLKDRLKDFSKKSTFRAKHVHVIGAGVMGGDIAAWCAMRGLTVTLQDQSYEQMGPAFARANALYQKRLKKPHLIRAAIDRLIPDPQGDGVARADVIIEAVFENLAVKQEIFKKIEALAKPNAILATNTSSIPLFEIAAVMEDKSRLVGIHFFNPVAMMELVEVVYGQNTSEKHLYDACAFVGQISRLPLPVKSSPGFLVNRILMPYLLESMQLLSEGVQAEAIDKSAKDFGMMMGPIELADTVGLDVCLAVANNLTQYYGGHVPPKLEKMVANKQLGKKTGQGFYNYKNGKAIKKPLPKKGLTKDIAQRLIMRMVNESFACLRENVVADANLLDAGMIFGTGFAPFRGGPMHYAEQFGKAQLSELFVELANQYGERFNLVS